MSSATTNGTTVSQRFDALGRRVARNNDIYVQTGQQTVADYVSGTTPTTPKYTYVYASYIDEPMMRAGTGGLRYYHRGQQYSITALTDSSGNVTERYAYTAYGTPTITDGAGVTLTTSADSNRYTYTGREWDETLSLYHFRARIYDSASGRFLGRDPVGYVDGMSLHGVYFALSLVDPFGYFKLKYKNHAGSPADGKPPCGRATWNTDFVIVREAGDPVDLSGIIVQKITMKSNVTICAGCNPEFKLDPTSPEYKKKYWWKQPFWELWDIDAGGAHGSHEQANTPAQDFVQTPNWGAGTKGNTVVTLEAVYYRGVGKPNDFKGPPHKKGPDG